VETGHRDLIFFLNLASARSAKTLTLALGGRERCNPDYELRRRAFAYFVLDYIAEGSGMVELGVVAHELCRAAAPSP
jgi:hypothetical protein